MLKHSEFSFTEEREPDDGVLVSAESMDEANFQSAPSRPKVTTRQSWLRAPMQSRPASRIDSSPSHHNGILGALR